MKAWGVRGEGMPWEGFRPEEFPEPTHTDLAGHAGGLIPVHPHEFSMQNWSWVGCCMGAGYGEASPEIEARARAHILSLVEAGRYRPAPSPVIGFEEIPEALRGFVSREIVGRVVARIA